MKVNRLIPMLPVKNMLARVGFYCGMLGFEVEQQIQMRLPWVNLRRSIAQEPCCITAGMRTVSGRPPHLPKGFLARLHDHI